MPSFEEWYATWLKTTPSSSHEQDMRQSWEASEANTLFRANSKLGDEGNEAAKYQRRVEAVGAILDHDHELTQEELIAIIAKAQG